MDKIIENMCTRRSVRKYKSDMVPTETVNKIIRAGLCAASGRNGQSAVIVAVTNKDVRDRMAKINASFMDSDTDPFYGAPIVLVVLADKSRPTYLYDGSLVMGNLMNAAHALGVDSCWIHRAKETFETEEWKQWLGEIGLKGEYEGIGNCILGYADGYRPADIPRKEGRVFVID